MISIEEANLVLQILDQKEDGILLLQLSPTLAIYDLSPKQGLQKETHNDIR